MQVMNECEAKPGEKARTGRANALVAFVGHCKLLPRKSNAFAFISRAAKPSMELSCSLSTISRAPFARSKRPKPLKLTKASFPDTSKFNPINCKLLKPAMVVSLLLFSTAQLPPIVVNVSNPVRPVKAPLRPTSESPPRVVERHSTWLSIYCMYDSAFFETHPATLAQAAHALIFVA